MLGNEKIDGLQAAAFRRSEVGRAHVPSLQLRPSCRPAASPLIPLGKRITHRRVVEPFAARFRATCRHDAAHQQTLLALNLSRRPAEARTGRCVLGRPRAQHLDFALLRVAFADKRCHLFA